ncbi:MAG: hypothetical protein GY719_20415 [bacterium]|nr:hypothetical protein [bacterium]
MIHSRVHRALVFAIVALMLPLPATAAKEGFGKKRKILQLSRINPPRVLIRGERVAVEVNAADRSYHDVAQRFRAQLASELVGSDTRFQLDSDRPETLVKVEVLQDEFQTYKEHRQGTQRRKVGEDRNGKAIYRDEKVTITYTTLKHHLRFAYTVTEARDDATLLADSSQVDYSNVVREGATLPTQAEIEGSSLEKAVNEIVRLLAPTREMIEVLLPKGTLAEQISFAEAGLWNRYSESLETMPPLPAAQDDSYRQYGIGLAYEALGYGAESPETTLRYLEKAAEQYNLALNANPGEKYFSQPFEGSFFGILGRKTLGSLSRALGGRGESTADQSTSRRSIPPPVQRVETSLAKYRALFDQSKELQVSSAGGARSMAGEENNENAVTNELVIEMVEAELDEAIIMTAIEDALGCAFDQSPMGLIQLKKAGVPSSIISKIQSSECDS